MSNSQPAVACGYGEAQQGISNIQGKYTKIWSVGNSLLDIQSREKSDEPAKSRGPADS
jgi:hypothetical protein